jgi:hypothetical protein
MKKTGSVLLAAALLAGAALAPGSAGAKTKLLPNCAAKKSTTLAANKDGRVYSVGFNAYACSYKANKRFLLGDTSECQNQTEADDFRLGDGVLGYMATSCDLVSGNSTIRVISLKTGKPKYSASPVDATWSGGDYSTDFGSWEMKRNGSIAWIGHFGNFVTTPTSGPPPAEQFQVWKIDADGAVKLDSGANIDRGSLALGSFEDPDTGLSPIYWIKGGTPVKGALK